MIERIQEALHNAGLDGWLFFDHHHRDLLAYRILHLSQNAMVTRRWYYLVPAEGEPRKLVHRIESGTLDALPGSKVEYSSWAEQHRSVKEMLRGCQRIAMQYSPECAIPYVSMVDAGTMEVVRASGVQVASSADLVQEFEARLDDSQFEQHVKAGKLVDQVRRDAFRLIGDRQRSASPVNELEVQRFILDCFERDGLIADHGPIVAANANASDAHYEPSRDRAASIGPGDFVLIDLWAKLREAGAVYYDVTWTGFCGPNVSAEIERVFSIVRDARKRASDFVIRKIGAGERIAGFQVDDEARGHINALGFGERFFHRTGHSIGTEVHGTGANMDNLEAHDTRPLIPGTCFSVEPGIYLEHFGIRSEVNLWVKQGSAWVTGEEQEHLVSV